MKKGILIYEGDEPEGQDLIIDDLINQLEVEIKQHKYIKEVRVNILKIISDYKQDYNWDFTLIDLNNYLFN